MTSTQRKKAHKTYKIIKKIYKQKPNRTKLKGSVLKKLWQLEFYYLHHIKKSRLGDQKFSRKQEEKFHDLILDIHKHPGKLIFYLKKNDYSELSFDKGLYEFFNCYRIYLTNKKK